MEYKLGAFRGVTTLRAHPDLVRHYEGGVETHTNLPDEIAHDSAGIPEKLQGPALRDGAEMLHELIVSHTVASVLERNGVSGHNDF